MEERVNRRGYWEYFVKGQHLNLHNLKREAQTFGLPSKTLYKENIPDCPKPEFHCFYLKHETTRLGLEGIRRDGGFRDPFGDVEPRVWWSLSVHPEQITSAETRLLEETFPDQTEEQASEQQNFLWKFTTSPAFLKTSRLGCYRFTFPLEEVLMAYSQQFCGGAQPVMRVYETVLYKQELMHVVLVHSPDNQNFSQYPLLTDDPKAVCAYRNSYFSWRPEAMSNTHAYELVISHDRKQLEAVGVSPRQFYVWNHIAVALHVEKTRVLEFDVEKLRNNLKFCVLDKMKNDTRQNPDTFDEAKQFVKSLWPDWRGSLEAELSLQQSLSVPDIKLVLVGRPGVGKTSSRRLILGEQVFGTDGSAAGLPSGTTESSLQEGTVFHWKVSIIDTPGLSEPPNPEVRTQIFRCINMSAPAHHIFILVLRLGTLSAEVKDNMMQMVQVFGTNVLRRTIILLTHMNQAEPEVQSQLQRTEDELRVLFSQVCNRCQVFNIHPDHKDPQQVWDLLYEGVKLAVSYLPQNNVN